MNPRVMVYVQHLLGIGHQRRTATIARALGERGLSVCYVSGGLPVPGLDVGAAEFVQLPPLKARNARYQGLVDAKNNPLDDALRTRRTDQLLQTYRRVSPAVLLIETFPFGRKLLSFELLPLLETAARSEPRPLVVSSVRDILEPKRKPGRMEQIVGLVRRHFDLVLVHADPGLVELSASFALAGQIADRIAYTGYVLESLPAFDATEEGRGEILISTGGGVGGERLLKVALQARALANDDSRWRCLVGHSLPDSLFEELRQTAPSGLNLERNRSDFPALLRNARVSVSQAGYNTVIEVLDAGVPAVLVPFAAEGETEQGIRAHLLSERGLVETLDPHKLDARALLRAIARARDQEATLSSSLDTSGAATTARILAERIAIAADDPIHMPSNASQAAWAALEAELDNWAESSCTASFWWRDDDASQARGSLRQLLALSASTGIPLALAVIPNQADRKLSQWLAELSQLSVIQHGFAHANHAPAREKRAEYGDHRDLGVMLAELQSGWEELIQLFPTQALPVLVPPWNRICDPLISRLPDIGFTGLSTFQPRHRAQPVKGLGQSNCHADLIDWRGTRSYAGDSVVLEQITAHLRQRRQGKVEDEATGILSHHRDHDAGCWRFLEQLFRRTLRHPAARWTTIAKLMWIA